ncbi:MAG: hypothetical protein AUI58_07935 [Chloroflexi bacterium 13_1_40CM_2_70_6]|nr:MAG: hypothetical protein AUI58_07935 [Chloroflexi bacterium 13_1_40CM_2_70_6]
MSLSDAAPQGDRSKATWDLRDGDRPTIFVELPDRRAVEALRALFLGLALTGQSTAVGEQPGTELKGMTGLDLVLAKAPAARSAVQRILDLFRFTEDPRKHLLRVDDSPKYRWTCTADEWRTSAELLEPFLEDRSGHQYLTDEEVDDALVEVSYHEVRNTT